MTITHRGCRAVQDDPRSERDEELRRMSDRRAPERPRRRRAGASRARPPSQAVALALATLSGPGVAGPPGLTAQERPAEEPTRYILLPRSRLEVETGKSGLFSGFVHDHLVRATEFEGFVHYDADDVVASSVAVVVWAEGLEVLTPADSSDRAKIRQDMMRDVLKAEEHTSIRFESTRVQPTRGGVLVVGDLTLAGETREVEVPMALDATGDTLRAWGGFQVRQTDFGIEPQSLFLGTVKVKDEVAFRITVLAVRSGAAGGQR